METLAETRPLLDRCRTLSKRGAVPRPAQIVSLLGVGDLTDSEIAHLGRPDPTKPYGRQVLIATPTLESMLATWTRGVPCLPHDHGGSFGAVRVIRGTSHHKIWRIVDGKIHCVREEFVEPGGVMTCGPDMVHSMGDAGAADQLVTLHLYHDPIDHMLVYDLAAERTFVVDGNCGAWIPHDEPHLIRAVHSGFLTPAQLLPQ